MHIFRGIRCTQIPLLSAHFTTRAGPFILHYYKECLSTLVRHMEPIMTTDQHKSFPLYPQSLLSIKQSLSSIQRNTYREKYCRHLQTYCPVLLPPLIQPSLTLDLAIGPVCSLKKELWPSKTASSYFVIIVFFWQQCHLLACLVYQRRYFGTVKGTQV